MHWRTHLSLSSFSILLLVGGLAWLWVLPSAVGASPPPPSAVYIIFDGSGSMWGQLPDGTHKVTAARDVLAEFVAQDFGNKEIALRAYGHRREGDCSDTELVVPFAKATDAARPIQAFADRVNPKGKTPISRSLRAALADMGTRSGEIILISDGIETCGEDPCELVRLWREKDIAIKIHVVGLGLNEKERAAMQCIADAAGTAYQDAQSTEELAEGLRTIQTSTPEPEPETSAPPKAVWQKLTIIGKTPAGDRVRVYGTATREGFDSIAVGSQGHNSVPPGEWNVSVGVETRNGNLYKPISKTVLVKDKGSTRVEFEVVEPPYVECSFLDRGETFRRGYVSAWRDGEELFGFRTKDRAYLDPGVYEFRATPNNENELSLDEEIAHGDQKQLSFAMVPTVHVHLKMVPKGLEERFRAHLELWSGGELVYKVHSGNGARVLAGTYDVHLPLRMTPFVYEGLTITSDPKQDFVLDVPVGYVTVHYQNQDGSAMEDARCIISRSTNGAFVTDKNQRTGRRIPLTAGTYRLSGWAHLGDFDAIDFDIAVAGDVELFLRAK